MTIKELGHRNATKAGIWCDQCEGRISEISQMTDFREHNIAEAAMYAEGFIMSRRTDATSAQQDTEEHNTTHPDHTIVLYRYDEDHPLPKEDIMTLVSYGIKG